MSSFSFLQTSKRVFGGRSSRKSYKAITADLIEKRKMRLALDKILTCDTAEDCLKFNPNFDVPNSTIKDLFPPRGTGGNSRAAVTFGINPEVAKVDAAVTQADLLEVSKVITSDRVSKVVHQSNWASAPGHDQLPYTFLKKVFKRYETASVYLTRIYVACITLGYIPKPLRQARLVLIPKPNGGVRPICIQSILTRTLHRVILSSIEFEKKLPPTQFCSRRNGADLMCAAVREEIRALAYSPAVTGDDHGVVISLDASNAFNSIDHMLVMKAIDENFENRALRRYLKNYIRHFAIFKPSGEPIRRVQGVPQGDALSMGVFSLALELILDPWRRSMEARGIQATRT